MRPHQALLNFGRNICFTPRHLYRPRTEQEVLDILDRHAGHKIRVMGSRHSWSAAIVSDDVILDVGHFNQIRLEETGDGETWATIGAGCQIKHILRDLHARSNVTLPALGLITEQTIAGAIATGTHGSGRHSMSHYVEEVRLATYDPLTGKACIRVLREGRELRAARCALGCLGVVLSVRLRCIPKYLVEEKIVRYDSLDEVFAKETEYPLQQCFLVPHLWQWFGLHQRIVRDPQVKASRLGWLFKLYTILGIDIACHVIIKSLTNGLRSRRGIRNFMKNVLPRLILQDVTVVDRSDRLLTMEHELFRHLETELFVRASQLPRAMEFIQQVLSVADGARSALSPEFTAELRSADLLDQLDEIRGIYTMHYPVTVRRVLPDDTLISPTSGPADSEWFYALSFITYARPRETFITLADFLARAMAVMFEARPHWGKHHPLTSLEIEPLYPHLVEFRALAMKYDPQGVFRNDFCNRVLGFAPVDAPIPVLAGSNSEMVKLRDGNKRSVVLRTAAQKPESELRRPRGKVRPN